MTHTSYLCLHLFIIECAVAAAVDGVVGLCVKTNLLICIHTQFNWILYYVYNKNIWGNTCDQISFHFSLLKINESVLRLNSF